MINIIKWKLDAQNRIDAALARAYKAEVTIARHKEWFDACFPGQEYQALVARAEKAEEENSNLLNVLWLAEDVVAGWHPNRDSRDKIEALSKAIKVARAALCVN